MRVFVTVFAALSLSACAATIGGKIENFHTTDSMNIQSRPRDFIGSVEKVGKALGYDVTGLDRSRNHVTLGASPSLFTSMLIGKYGTFSMEVTLDPNGRTIALVTSAGGNYNIGDREKVEARVGEFKAALARELGGVGG
jgi:hypothetical protein